MRRSWWHIFLAGLVVAVANSLGWHLLEYWYLHPESKRGIAQWAMITGPGLALYSLVPAWLGATAGAGGATRMRDTVHKRQLDKLQQAAESRDDDTRA